MRIPVSKIYRAFPELDSFSDQQCEVYIARARARKVGSGCLMTLGATVAGVAAAIVLGFLTARVIIPLGQGLGITISGALEPVAAMVLIGSHVVVAFMVGLLIRDAWLRRAIQGCLESDRCPKCDYSLLGLPVHQGAVTCPECGFSSELRVLGVEAADLLANEAKRSE